MDKHAPDTTSPLRVQLELGGLVEQLAEALAPRVAELLQQVESVERGSPWLNVAGACEYLRLSRHTLYRLSAAGAIPVHKKENGQGLRFHRAELDAWMHDHYPRVDRLA